MELKPYLRKKDKKFKNLTDTMSTSNQFGIQSILSKTALLHIKLNKSK